MQVDSHNINHQSDGEGSACCGHPHEHAAGISRRSLLGGIGGATLFEIILRVLTIPYFGKLLTDRPLTLVSVLRDFHDVPGLRAQVTSDKKTLTLTFEHEERAREFAMLNNLQEI